MKHFGYRECCCIQYWQQFLCIQYFHSAWLHICLHLFFLFIPIIAGNTLNAGNDAASNTCHHLSASNTCIQVGSMYACIHCCFDMIIERTRNTLDSGNNAVSIKYKLFGCIQYFLYNLQYILGNTLNVIQKRQTMGQ